MLSISNAPVEIADRILAAAASCVIDFGVERVTLAEIARRAGVSRPTVYRRWPDTRSVLASPPRWVKFRRAEAAAGRWSTGSWRWPNGCAATSW
jgi:AcrR family transcriptional regulator